FKKLSKEGREEINNPTAVIAYLLQNTSAIKRPIVETSKPVLIGFDAENYQNILL
ncbi:MAG: arsenate reductase, partial [Flavobacteriales bacterium]